MGAAREEAVTSEAKTVLLLRGISIGPRDFKMLIMSLSKESDLEGENRLDTALNE